MVDIDGLENLFSEDSYREYLEDASMREAEFATHPLNQRHRPDGQSIFDAMMKTEISNTYKITGNGC